MYWTSIDCTEKQLLINVFGKTYNFDNIFQFIMAAGDISCADAAQLSLPGPGVHSSCH